MISTNLKDTSSIIAISEYPYLPNGEYALNKRVYLITPLQPHNGRLEHNATKDLFATVAIACDVHSDDIPEMLLDYIEALSCTQALIAPDLSTVDGVHAEMTKSEVDSTFTVFAPAVSLDAIAKSASLKDKDLMDALFGFEFKRQERLLERLGLDHYSVCFSNSTGGALDMTIYDATGNELEVEREVSFSDVQMNQPTLDVMTLKRIAEQTEKLHETALSSAAFNAMYSDDNIVKLGHYFCDNDIFISSDNTPATYKRNVAIIVDGVVAHSQIECLKLRKRVLSSDAFRFIDFAQNTLKVPAGGFQLPFCNNSESLAVTGFQL
ncbi:hypothetical protein [Photobacterium leiognathi]|uniref:hypothetical protein n=1 Tax=Photobacterium leiognathi TaxID=553611 RepID=UPI0029824BD8|nr:hypothetical protein [Photobacterium leiognathi]